jgi:hypothetical protein
MHPVSALMYIRPTKSQPGITNLSFYYIFPFQKGKNIPVKIARAKYIATK